MSGIRKYKKTIGKVINHTVLVIGSVIFMFPLFWLISTSLKTEGQMWKVPPELWPDPFKWDNYSRMWTNFPFMMFLKNTVLVTALSVGGVLITAPLVAYAFARLDWKGRGVCFMLLMATVMIPNQVTMIPLYIIFKDLGWVDTLLPLWVPSWFGGGAWSIFLVRQFLMTIPKEMEESAYIDGAGHLRTYVQIMLPLVSPTLTTISIQRFMGAWNDFMGPLIYISSTSKFTLSLGLRLFQQQTQSQPSEYGMMMAATVMMIVPVIVFFFIGQRQFIEGVALTGMKA